MEVCFISRFHSHKGLLFEDGEKLISMFIENRTKGNDSKREIGYMD